MSGQRRAFRVRGARPAWGARERAREEPSARVRDVEIFSLGAINAPREGEASETLSLSARLRERTRRPTATRRARTARGAGTRASRPCVARATRQKASSDRREKAPFRLVFFPPRPRTLRPDCTQTGCLTDCPHETAPRE